MNYEQFQKELHQRVAKSLGPCCNVTLSHVSGNNGVLRSALKIMDQQNDIHGIIYPQDFYQAFTDGMELSEIVNQIIELQKQLPSKGALENLNLFDFNQVKDRIVFKLVHSKMNAKQLDNMPHLPFLDLVIVFCIVLDTTSSGVANVQIYNHHLNLWDVDTETLRSCASKNGPHILPPALESIASIVGAGHDYPLPTEKCSLNQCFVLSNQQNYWGATSILYEGVLQNIGDILQKNYFVIPSSIHDVIIYPDEMGLTKEMLDEIIPSINETELEPLEILSGHTYYYDRKLGQLLMP